MTQPSPERTEASRTDASVSLLTSIVDTALDPGYARAAAVRRAAGSPGSEVRAARSSAGPLALIALVVIGLVVGVAVADVRSSVVPQARLAQDALAERVRERVALTDAAAAEVAELTTQIEGLTENSAEGEPDTRAGLERAAASAPLEGAGVRVILEDSDGRGNAADDEGLGRVLDRDLQLVANGLWAAGADGIAINGRRLTSTSAIRSAGEAILVDYRPLEPPYVVEAVGASPDDLRATFEAGPSGLALRTLSEAFGLRFTVTQEPELSLPAGSIPVLRSATPIPTQGEQS
jgi:uncharacterized protein YlxW (UPF0749 family)